MIGQLNGGMQLEEIAAVKHHGLENDSFRLNATCPEETLFKKGA